MNPLCVIFANCQADGLNHFLSKAGFPFDIEVYRNYQIILREQSPEALKAAASRCQLFIYQPTKELKHGELSSEYYIEEVIPKSAKTISFAYQFNTGFFPLIGHGASIIGAKLLWPVLASNDLHTVLGSYDQDAFKFPLFENFIECLTEQRRREVDCDIKTADWIADNRNKRLFLTYNHPCSILFCELARQVMNHLGLPCPELKWSHYNEAGLPCEVPVSRHVINTYGWQEKESEHAPHYYRALLEKAWQLANQRA